MNYIGNALSQPASNQKNMRWTPGGVSDDIEDRRDDSGGGGGGFGFGHLGIGGVIVIGLLSLLFHRNLFVLFSGAPSSQAVRSVPNRQQDAEEQPEVQFVSFVLDDVQRNWSRILPQTENIPY